MVYPRATRCGGIIFSGLHLHFIYVLSNGCRIYFVYLLVSKKNSKISSYVGMTKDLNKRITLHNTSKGAKYTKGKKWLLAYKKSYNTKSKALKEEYSLKKDKKKREKIKQSFNL